MTIHCLWWAQTWLVAILGCFSPFSICVQKLTESVHSLISAYREETNLTRRIRSDTAGNWNLIQGLWNKEGIHYIHTQEEDGGECMNMAVRKVYACHLGFFNVWIVKVHLFWTELISFGTKVWMYLWMAYPKVNIAQRVHIFFQIFF